VHDRVLAAALAEATQAGVTGKEATPFVLDYFHRETGGESLEANVRIILRNARLAAEIAAAIAEAA
jgi:pseudouridine-5'-phosphate glycosidase